MMERSGTKSGVVAIGLGLLLAFVVVPALSGAASATPTTSTLPANAPSPWAYCGSGSWNHSMTNGTVTRSWNATFAWCTIFHVTPTSSDNATLELNRTMAVSVVASLTSPYLTLTYSYHAQEQDVAFANVTNDSVVYSGGQPLAALGVVNASAFDNSSIHQSFHATEGTATASSSLSVQGNASASVAFTPSLGLVPRNLTGVSMWNATAMANASAAWALDWSWSHTSFSGQTSSASASRDGNLSGTFPVFLSGYQAGTSGLRFSDHMARLGVVLTIQGPLDVRDGFVFLPHGFDLFGGAAQAFDGDSMGSATVLSAEALYFSMGPHGPRLTAAGTGFGADNSAINSGSVDMVSGVSTTDTNPSGTVLAQPVSVAQAQAESSQMLLGPGASGTTAHPRFAGFLIGLAVAAVAVVVVVVALGVVRGSAYSQRKASHRSTGPMAGYEVGGIPPGVMAPPVAPIPTEPAHAPVPAEGPQREE